MEGVVLAPCKTHCTASEENVTPVNGIVPSDGSHQVDVNHNEDDGMEENGEEDTSGSNMVSNGVQQPSVDTGKGSDESVAVNTLTTSDAAGGDDQEGTAMSGEETESESTASTDDSNIAGTSKVMEAHIIPATVDLEKLHIRPENMPTFSPSTSASAASTADEESACSSAEVSSGTSTPSSKVLPQPGILYSILTSKLQSKVRSADNVPVPQAEEDTTHKKTYKCRFCSRLFLKQYDFKQHERCHQVANEKPFQCLQCGKRYAVSFKLKVHMRVHTGEQPYQCDRCDRRFMTRGHLVKHTQRCETTHGVMRNYVTNVLDVTPSKKQGKKPVKTAEKAKTDIKSAAASNKGKVEDGIDSQGIYRCDNCYAICRTKENFLKHLKLHKDEETVEGLFTCKKCGKCYELETNLKNHMKLHDGSAPYVCKICGFCCLRKYNLQIHMNWHKTQKENKSLVRAYNRRYKCTVCKKGFRRVAELMFHMKGHPSTQKKEPSAAKTKQTTSKDKSALMGEWPNVKDKMSYGSRFSGKCPHCHKHFSRKFDILKHIKTHTDRTHHVCKYCDWTFATRTNFLKHMRLHTSSGTHACRSCGLVYRKKVELHRQETMCWLKTKRAVLGVTVKSSDESESDRSSHYWEVMKPDPITCKWCDLTFSSLSNMYTHLRRHEEKGRACRWCGLPYEKKKQEHDPQFNCWLKTRQGILKKENEKFKKIGNKPMDILKEEVVKHGKKSTDMWRFKCKYCNWAFVDAGNKKVHQRLHEEEGHSCRWCGLLYQMKTQKHNKNSRCWLTTTEGRAQKKSSVTKKNFAVLPKLPKGTTTNDTSTDGRKEFKCDKCDRLFDKQASVVLHMLVHSEVRPYACTKCDRRFKQQANLAKHEMFHNFQCRQCLKRFEKESDYQKHITDAPHTFKCKNCERCYISKISLKNHAQKVHKNESVVMKSEAKKFACKICKMSFEQSHSLALHERFVHRATPAASRKDSSASNEGSTGPPYSCSRCERTYTMKCHLTKHELTHVAAPYKCHHCGVMFKKRLDHQNHLIKKHKEKPLKCSECEQSFLQKSMLDGHMQIHKAELNNECHICGKVFVKKKNYLNHIQIHSKTTPYACNKCGTGFLLQHQHELHQKIHHGGKSEFSYSDQSSGEDGFSSEHAAGMPSSNQSKGTEVDEGRPHGCHTCGKRFKMKCHLVWHQRSRQECGGQPAAATGWTKKHNKCRYCNMIFANSARLMIHTKNVHHNKQVTTHLAGVSSDQPTEKQNSTDSTSLDSSAVGKLKPPFTCPKCSRTFSTLWSQQRHIKYYHKDGKNQVYVCQYCQETSTRLDFHNAHEKLHTNNIYKIECKVCHIGFKCNEDVETHMATHGKADSSKQEEVPKTTGRPYSCRFCNLGFVRLAFLKRHERSHAQESRPYSCKHCSMKFRRLAGLTKHESLKHPNEEKTESEGSKPKAGPIVRAEDYKNTSPNFTCRGCNKEFIRQNTFVVHEKACLEKLGKTAIEMESDIAESASSTDLPGGMEDGTPSESLSSESDAFDASAETSSGKKSGRYQCKSCSRYITDDKHQYEYCRVCRMNKKEESDSQHEESEAGEEEELEAQGHQEENSEGDQGQDSGKLVCKYCSRVFNHEDGPGGLEYHMKRAGCRNIQAKKTSNPAESDDSDTTVFSCDMCERTFNYKHSLSQHKRFHTGECPYSCSLCKKSFPRKDYLQRHQRKEHPTSDDETDRSETTGPNDPVGDAEEMSI